MNQTSEQRTTVYPPSTVEQIVKYSFFPYMLNEWFNLDLKIRNAESVLLFKRSLLSFIYQVQGSIYIIFDPKGLKFLTCLGLDFIHLNKHRF